eukprot:jgi/Tetstr1/444254/TSEL_032147.t1
MAPITERMIRSRAEHNEGMLTNLEEVALHQQDIEKIELLGILCRHLKIIYIQNNLIGKLQNLNKLKELEYLNAAVNNIVKIENLQRCESLKRLDLTVNFIPKAGLLSVHSLQANYALTELFLVGNPCSDWPGYRPFVIATLPQLKKLDGSEITPTERILANQEFGELQAKLRAELISEGVDPDEAAAVEDDYDLDEDIEEVGTLNENGEMVRPWCRETRILEHRESEKLRLEAEEKKKANTSKLFEPADERKPVRRDDFPEIKEGERVWQKNEGDWAWAINESEDGAEITLEVKVGKYMDTSLIKADVQPHFIRLLIKGKLLQLELGVEVCPDQSKATRSKATGALLVSMPKLDPAQHSIYGIGAGGAIPSKDGGERVVKLQAGRGKPSKPGVAARAPKGSKDFIIEKAQKAVLYQANDGDDDDDDFLPPL